MALGQAAVTVSPKLVEKHVESSPLLHRAWRVLTSDQEVLDLLRMSNVMAVDRLLYNDHGPVHARIVAGSALEMFNILYENGVKPSSLENNTVDTVDEARLIVLMAAYLHDIGNSVHRQNHELIGALLAKDILSRLLPQILGSNHRKLNFIRAEIMHAIYATAPDVDALTIEAGIVKVADATDMAEGRARYPYRKGKMDIHAISALAIKRVEISNGDERPVRITVFMNDSAGFFQIEKVMLPKLVKTPIKSFVEVQPVLISGGSERRMPVIKL